MKRSVPAILLLFMAWHAHAQEAPASSAVEMSRKGRVFLYWGYNRAYYDKSDIHFKGEHYDFTLHDARAEDMPEPFDPEVYFNLKSLSVPQFNFRAGYFIGDRTTVSLGWDHMKYRLVTTQQLNISGYIDPGMYPYTGYSGTFDHSPLLYNKSFMDYHHSDGFNYIRAGVERHAPLAVIRPDRIELTMYAGAGAGIMLPWTDFTFFGQHFRNKLHAAGFAGSLNSGIRLELFRWFFLQFNAQAGMAGMPDIVLEDHLPSRASQNIVFFERSWAFGAYLPLFRPSSD
jgi:hypothetical protein